MVSVKREWNEECGLYWCAKKAAYLRIHGIAATVDRELLKGGGMVWNINVPLETQEKAKNLIREFDDKEREKEFDYDDPCAAWVRHYMAHYGKAWFGWYAILAGETRTHDAHLGIWAYEAGGEVWERYRDLFRSEGTGPLHVNGFFRCGAAWAFNEDFSGPSEMWLNQSPQEGAGSMCKRLYLVGEEVYKATVRGQCRNEASQ